VTTEIERAPLASRVSARLPDVAWLVVAYLISRVLTTGLLGIAFATVNHWSIAHNNGPGGFFGFLQSWDGDYYRQIAENGYPQHPPVSEQGVVTKSTWAFLPLFPALAKLVMLPGLNFDVAAPLVAVVFGGLATIALYLVLEHQIGRTRARWAAVLFAFGPMSFILEATYAESVFLFFMFATLALAVRGRYFTAIPFGVLAAFAHPGALGLAVLLGIAWIRTRNSRALLATVIVGVAGFSWPLIAALVTGTPNAYFDTEVAWWSDYLGTARFIPFTPWFVFAGHYWGFIGVAIVVLAIGGFLLWLTRPHVKELGDDIRSYTFGYVAYLVAVFLPQQSVFRMLLPLSPALGHRALTRSRARRVVSLAVSIALQPVAILLFWVVYPP
jgi:Gpi18-like mannosyltransferase